MEDGGTWSQWFLTPLFLFRDDCLVKKFVFLRQLVLYVLTNRERTRIHCNDSSDSLRRPRPVLIRPRYPLSQNRSCPPVWILVLWACRRLVPRRSAWGKIAKCTVRSNRDQDLCSRSRFPRIRLGRVLLFHRRGFWKVFGILRRPDHLFRIGSFLCSLLWWRRAIWHVCSHLCILPILKWKNNVKIQLNSDSIELNLRLCW